MLVTRTTVRKIERKHADELAYVAKIHAEKYSSMQNEIDELKRTLSDVEGGFAVVKSECDLYRTRLDDVIAMETPSCANIGRKMARTARGE